MIVVVDASAAAKLVIEEPNSQLVHRLWDDPVTWLAPTTLVPEVAAAIPAVHRAGRLPGIVEDVHAEWRSLVDDIGLHVVDAGLAEGAGALAESRTIRGADAVHVTLALELGEDTDVALASFDQRQRRAALATGVTVVPAAMSPPSGLS